MNLADELRAASADSPPTSIDLDRLVAREERRKVRARWLAAGCAAAVAVTATTIGVRAATTTPVERPPGYAFAPDRVPDVPTLPDAAKVWPDAVHELPLRLPDGSDYAVHAALGGDRYVVASGLSDPSNSPQVFDTRAGTATPLAPEGAIPGVAQGRVLTSKVVGDQVVWMLEGFRRDKWFRELWAAGVDGTGLRRLAELPSGVGPRFAVSGDTVLWDLELPGVQSGKPPFTTVWRVSLSGGRPAEVPGSAGWSLVNDGPWLTTQVLRDGLAPYDVGYDAGQLWNPVTGQRWRWIAPRDVRFLQCGPAWCHGTGNGQRTVLQKLDGTGYVELPYSASVRSSREGRLLTSGVRLGDTSLEFVWDRQTGRAGILGRYDHSQTPTRTVTAHNSDFDPPVLTWRTADHLMLLDLDAIG